MSHCLAERAIDHVVIERGEVANSWKTERWDSLRLLTPNWQSRLPGFGYRGDDPDGYRNMPETIRFLDDYAEAISAPVETHTAVTSVRGDNGGYRVTTEAGDWQAKTVVLANGACCILLYSKDVPHRHNVLTFSFQSKPVVSWIIFKGSGATCFRIITPSLLKN